MLQRSPGRKLPRQNQDVRTTLNRWKCCRAVTLLPLAANYHRRGNATRRYHSSANAESESMARQQCHPQLLARQPSHYQSICLTRNRQVENLPPCLHQFNSQPTRAGALDEEQRSSSRGGSPPRQQEVQISRQAVPGQDRSNEKRRVKRTE